MADIMGEGMAVKFSDSEPTWNMKCLFPRTVGGWSKRHLHYVHSLSIQKVGG